MTKKYRPWLKSLSGLLLNLSAGWLGLAFITPKITNLNNFSELTTLIWETFFGILFYVGAGFIEWKVSNE